MAAPAANPAAPAIALSTLSPLAKSIIKVRKGPPSFPNNLPAAPFKNEAIPFLAPVFATCLATVLPPVAVVFDPKNPFILSTLLPKKPFALTASYWGIRDYLFNKFFFNYPWFS